MTSGRRYLIGAMLFALAYWYLTPAGQRMAQDFSLPIAGKNNETLTLANYQGQPLILNFWATWCTNCLQEKELLARLQEQLTVISVLTADPNPDPHALRGRLVALDSDNRVANLYGIRHLPQTFFINADYQIIGHWRKPLTAKVVSKIFGYLPQRYILGGWF